MDAVRRFERMSYCPAATREPFRSGRHSSLELIVHSHSADAMPWEGSKAVFEAILEAEDRSLLQWKGSSERKSRPPPQRGGLARTDQLRRCRAPMGHSACMQVPVRPPVTLRCGSPTFLRVNCQSKNTRDFDAEKTHSMLSPGTARRCGTCESVNACASVVILPYYIETAEIVGTEKKARFRSHQAEEASEQGEMDLGSRLGLAAAAPPSEPPVDIESYGRTLAGAIAAQDGKTAASLLEIGAVTSLLQRYSYLRSARPEDAPFLSDFMRIFRSFDYNGSGGQSPWSGIASRHLAAVLYCSRREIGEISGQEELAPAWERAYVAQLELVK